MTIGYIKFRENLHNDASNLTVQDQYELAAKLATDCGYQLVAEDSERSLEIKALIIKIKEVYKNTFTTDELNFVIQGLEALLK